MAGRPEISGKPLVVTVLVSALAIIATLAGGLAVIRWPARIVVLAAISLGATLSGILVDLLPEAIDAAHRVHVPLAMVFALSAAAYLVLGAAKGGGARMGHAVRPAGTLSAAGFLAHGWFEGTALGIGFQAEPLVGILIAVVIVVHRASEGLGVMCCLARPGQSSAASMAWLGATAAAPMVGAMVAASAPLPAQLLPIGLSLVCGVLFYAAIHILLPITGKLPIRRRLPLVLLGAISILALASWLAR